MVRHVATPDVLDRRAPDGPRVGGRAPLAVGRAVAADLEVPAGATRRGLDAR